MDYTALAVAICCAAFWWRGAEFERIAPWRWVLPSVAVSVIVLGPLGGSSGSVLLGQGALFVAITVLRVMRDGKGRR